jgi:hypothetical protein
MVSLGEGPKRQNVDLRFGTQNISLCMAGSLMTVLKELQNVSYI